MAWMTIRCVEDESHARGRTLGPPVGMFLDRRPYPGHARALNTGRRGVGLSSRVFSWTSRMQFFSSMPAAAGGLWPANCQVSAN